MDQSSFTNSPWLIAGYNVLHRLLVPRHPPTALSSLSNQKEYQQEKSEKLIYKDARVHCEILKQRANPNPTHNKHVHAQASGPHQKSQMQPNPQKPNNVLSWQTPQTQPNHFPLPKQGAVLTENRPNPEDSKSMFHKPEPPTQKTHVPDNWQP